MEKINLSSLNLEEINDLIKPLGASAFRARQIFNWVYLKSLLLPLISKYPLKLLPANL